MAESANAIVADVPRVLLTVVIRCPATPQVVNWSL